MNEAIDALSDTRREIMLYVKQRGGATIAELANRLGISDEGTRQHLIHLERRGWIARRDARDTGGRSGRPASVYTVSARGEAFFPRRYDEIAVALIDAVMDLHGPDAIEAALARITDEKVRAWEGRLAGKSIEERVDMLKNYYQEGDDFVSVLRNGSVSIVERNCPYLDIATSRPALCSTTVSVFSRLLGFQVRRRQTFQGGNGCCEFEVCKDRPVDAERFRFAFETTDSSDQPGRS